MTETKIQRLLVEKVHRPLRALSESMNHFLAVNHHPKSESRQTYLPVARCQYPQKSTLGLFLATSPMMAR